MRVRGGRVVDSEDENEQIVGRKHQLESDDDDDAEDDDNEKETDSEEPPEYWDREEAEGKCRLNTLVAEFSLPCATEGEPKALKTMKLSDLLYTSEKCLVMVFLPYLFDPPDEKDAHGFTRYLLEFQREKSALEALGAKIVFITRDQPYAAAAMSEKLGLSFPILSDLTLKVSNYFVGKISYPRLRVMMGESHLKGIKGFRTSNLGIIAIDQMNRIFYKWVARMPTPSTEALIPANAPFPLSQPNLLRLKKVIFDVCNKGIDVIEANGDLESARIEYEATLVDMQGDRKVKRLRDISDVLDGDIGAPYPMAGYREKD